MSESRSVAQRVNGERLVVLGWSRAILMQLAHPLVAAGVADHSSFRAGGMAAVTRLHQTIRAMRRLTFGSSSAQRDTIDRIRAIHRLVNGRLSTAVGRFAAGTAYSAEDPELVLWVHATLLDSIPRCYDRLVAPLSDAERDQLCAETATVAVLLGARERDVPKTWAALQSYIAQTCASGVIAVGEQAQLLAAAVLQPRLVFFARPLVQINRLITIGMLSESFRRGYRLPWSEDDERRFARAASWIRRLRRFMPRSLALWSDARRRAHSVRRGQVP